MGFTIQAMPPKRLLWLVERSGCAFTSTLRGIEAVDDQGQTKGAVGFDGWMGNAAQMHVAIESPIAVRALLKKAFWYLFCFAGKDIALGLVPAHNHRALKFDKHLGFRETYRLKDGAAPGDDMVILEMRREDCRWLEK